MLIVYFLQKYEEFYVLYHWIFHFTGDHSASNWACFWRLRVVYSQGILILHMNHRLIQDPKKKRNGQTF